MQWKTVAIAAMLALGLAAGAQGMFNEAERDQVLAFWRQPGRYASAPSPGGWQVRLTPEGSEWLWNYDRARGLGKTPPNLIPGAQNEEQAAWETWIDARVAFDRQAAAIEASMLKGTPILEGPADPGPMPPGLAALMPAPPPFANAVHPNQHTVKFSDLTLTFVDNPPMRARYAYYRFPQGVMSSGQAVREMPEADLKRLFAKAGIDESARRVLAAVSLLEGGFDSVNTYDTGFVSVGFIQFASLRAGAGSLGAVLSSMKRTSPKAFDLDFRRFGLDVSEDGLLVAMDLGTGQERIGPEANQRIIEDKRLIAVFQRAGRLSEAFRIAQLRVAMERYHPANDQVLFLFNGAPMSARVGDLVKSECGIATLFDRKVNTGKLDPLPQVLTDLVAEHGLDVLSKPESFERQIVERMVWRKNYLAATGLTQPRLVVDAASRKGDPKTRAGKPTGPKR